MSRTVKHFSLHRLEGLYPPGGTELRVVSDLEAEVSPVIAVEEGVLRGYMARAPWPHRSVTLFLLQDLAPLVGQVDTRAGLPPGGAAGLDQRPVVNAYDLADLSSCHVFVNWRVMRAEGYTEDPLLLEGLLAHEHAHPLAEYPTAAASRRLRTELSVRDWPALPAEAGDQQARLQGLLSVLADTLCLAAPREVFASELAIRRGFGAALFHLDRRNLANAQEGLEGRAQLRAQLWHAVAQGRLSAEGAEILLLIGDLQGYLDLSLEIAAFYRAECVEEAQDLERVLETKIFPRLQPGVPEVYTALRAHYVALEPGLAPAELLGWSQEVLATLAASLAPSGLTVNYALHLNDT